MTKITEIITKEEVDNNHPLQYRIKTYKEVKDINNINVEVLDKEVVVNIIELDNEISIIDKQINELIIKKSELEIRKTKMQIL